MIFHHQSTLLRVVLRDMFFLPQMVQGIKMMQLAYFFELLTIYCVSLHEQLKKQLLLVRLYFLSVIFRGDVTFQFPKMLHALLARQFFLQVQHQHHLYQ